MGKLAQEIINWLQSTSYNPYLSTALISVVPLVEVRGAITVGIGLGLNPWAAFVLSCLSALLVCPLLLLCLKPLLKLLKSSERFKNFAVAVEDMFRSKAKKIEENAADVVGNPAKKKRIFQKCLGVFLFVAIPLPMTGVWTGSAVACFLDLEYKYSVPSIVLGNFTAGFIITLLNKILGEYSSLIILVLALFAFITVVALLSTFIVKYRKFKKARGEISKDEERAEIQKGE